MRNTFCKEERLCKKNLITQLFSEGNKFFSYPFRVIYLVNPVPAKFPVQLLISVPRSLFRKAADRNRVKRLIREAYRINKNILYEALSNRNEHLLLCLVYTSKEIVPFETVREKIIVILQRLKERNAEAAG
jgi:ribonuclease P protein component